MKQKPLKLSFVLPALNEIDRIPATLESIQAALEDSDQSWEALVVDNGSSDGTPEFARSVGASVISVPGATVAELRNHGAEVSSGDVLIFLDADTVLAEGWASAAPAVFSRIARGEQIIAGSHCVPEESDSWLLRYWFTALATDPRNTHLGSAHMIMSKDAFVAIGGFDGERVTGEDYEFCVRAKALGYVLVNEPRLRVIHPDFPRSIGPFVRRECWHGVGDLTSFGSWVGSKVMLAATAFLGIHLTFGIALALGLNPVAGVAFLGLTSLLVTFSALKSRHLGLSAVVVNSFLSYFYFVGRSMAVVKRLTQVTRGVSQ